MPRRTRFHYTSLSAHYPLFEDDLQQLFQDIDEVKNILFPEFIGDASRPIVTEPGKIEIIYKNQIFKSKQELNCVFVKALEESHEYFEYYQTDFFVRYKEINDEIYIYALKHITDHREWTTFQKPFNFKRSLVENFPSAKPASTKTQDKSKPDKVRVDRTTNRTANTVNCKKERKSKLLAAASAYQPGYFQQPKPATASKNPPNRVHLRSLRDSAKSGCHRCIIS